MKKLIVFVTYMLASSAIFAATTVPVQLLNPSGSTAGQAIVSTGPSSAPSWGGVGLNGIASIGANTVVANATGVSASPTAFAMPGCSASGSALQWTSGTGFTCGAGYAMLSGAAFTAPITVTDSSSSSTASVTITNTANTTNGVNLKLVGNGATTPSKTIRVVNGSFQIQSDSYASILLDLHDSGNLLTLGSISPSQTGGIIGTNTNNNADAGSVGEVITATQSSAVSLSNSAGANITSISLTAGDWNVSGVVCFTPANGTSVTNMTSGISTTSATLGALGSYSGISIPYTGNGGGSCIPTPNVRVQGTGTATVYLVSIQGFTAGTMTATGVIFARRPR